MTSDEGWFTSEDSFTIRRTSDVTEAGHVGASPDGTAEHGLHDMVAFLSEESTQVFDTTRDSLCIPAVVPYE